jgi:rhodanese-related sulfurtransferase
MEDITIEELKTRLDDGENIHLIDVREEWEHNTFNLGGRLIPLSTLPAVIDDYDEWMDQEVVVYCKIGGRSATAKRFMEKEGFSKVRNLIGGVKAWQSAFS